GSSIGLGSLHRSHLLCLLLLLQLLLYSVEREKGHIREIAAECAATAGYLLPFSFAFPASVASSFPLPPASFVVYVPSLRPSSWRQHRPRCRPRSPFLLPPTPLWPCPSAQSSLWPRRPARAGRIRSFWSLLFGPWWLTNTTAGR